MLLSLFLRGDYYWRLRPSPAILCTCLHVKLNLKFKWSKSCRGSSRLMYENELLRVCTLLPVRVNVMRMRQYSLLVNGLLGTYDNVCMSVLGTLTLTSLQTSWRTTRIEWIGFETAPNCDVAGQRRERSHHPCRRKCTGWPGVIQVTCPKRKEELSEFYGFFK